MNPFLPSQWKACVHTKVTRYSAEAGALTTARKITSRARVIIIIIIIITTITIIYSELSFGMNKWTYENCRKRKLCPWLYLNKKIWKELIVYFPLIRHVPHRKRRLQHFLVATGTYLPTCYLSTIRGYKGRSTDTRFNASSIAACIRCRGNVFTEPLPSNKRKDALYRAFV
jgi:hypothetical protein